MAKITYRIAINLRYITLFTLHCCALSYIPYLEQHRPVVSSGRFFVLCLQEYNLVSAVRVGLQQGQLM